MGPDEREKPCHLFFKLVLSNWVEKNQFKFTDSLLVRANPKYTFFCFLPTKMTQSPSCKFLISLCTDKKMVYRSHRVWDPAAIVR